jgi:hypothetical protein
MLSYSIYIVLFMISFEIDDKRRMNNTDIMEALFNLKTDLLNTVDNLGRNLPANTLDELIDQLGGPSQVAEVRFIMFEHDRYVA